MSPPRAGLAFLGSFLIMFALGALYAWSVFVVPLEQQLGDSRGSVSAIFSIATAGFTLAMLFGPRVHGRTSPARLVLAVFAMAAAGMLLCSFATRAWQFALFYGGMFGVANGIGYGLALQAVQGANSARRGLMTGLIVASYTAGSAVLAPLLSLGLERWGPAGTFRAMAGAFLLLGPAAALLIAGARVRLAPRTASRSETAPAPPPRWLAVLWTCFLLGSAAGLLTLGHAATIVAAAGDAGWLAAAAASLVAVANGVGRVAGGWLGDRLASRAILLWTQSLSGLALIAAALWPTAPVAFAAIGLVGLGYGCLAGGYPVIVAHLYGRAQVARVYGRIFTAWGIAAVLAPYLGGALFDLTGTYEAAFILCGGFAGIAAALGLLLPAARPRCQCPTDQGRRAET